MRGRRGDAVRERGSRGQHAPTACQHGSLVTSFLCRYDELMWEEVHGEDGSGSYFYNPATKASQWEKVCACMAERTPRHLRLGAQAVQGVICYVFVTNRQAGCREPVSGPAALLMPTRSSRTRPIPC